MELLTVEACGENYEDALAKCFVKVKNICGQAHAQVFRREAGNEPVTLIDWILETSRATTTVGGVTVCVEAEFFLWGSDE